MLHTEDATVAFEVGWQQLQRVSVGSYEHCLDTLQEAVVQEEQGWQPVVLSGRPGPQLDRPTLSGLAALEGSLQCLLSGLLPSAMPAEYQLSQFSEVIIPQFNARSGHWQMS